MSVKTPRFSGPFKWSALRQQLLSLRDDVHTIRKVAGRNITIDEHRGKGKVINVERKGTETTETPTGACCVGEECSIETEAACIDLSGVYQGDDTTCSPNPCLPCTGACCFDGSCETGWLEADCGAYGGSFAGCGTDCSRDPCAHEIGVTGACCFEDLTCLTISEAECGALFGTFQGLDTWCWMLPYPCGTVSSGACCFGGGYTCSIESPEDCYLPVNNGIWHGEGTCCGPNNPCPLPDGFGACCFEDGSCVVTEGEDICTGEGGTYHAGTPCGTNFNDCAGFC